MKGTFFLLFALLAALALAAAPPNAVDTTSIEISPSSQPDAQQAPNADNGSPQLSDAETLDEVPTDDTMLPELHSLTGSNETWSNISFFDISTASANPGDKGPLGEHLKGWYRIDVRVGLYGIHVGTFAGERLYNRMYKVFQQCKIGSDKDACSIRNVVDRSTDGQYHADGAIIVTVIVSEINKATQGLEDLTYRMMARTLQKMTEVVYNRNFVKFEKGGGDRDLTFYRVANEVMIAFPINGGPVQSIFKIKIDYDQAGPAKNIKVDWTCDNSGPKGQIGSVRELVSRPFVSDYYVNGKRQDSFKKEIATMFKWDENKIAPYTDCATKACLVPYHRPQEFTEWTESEVCDPAHNPEGCCKKDDPKRKKLLNCPPYYPKWRDNTEC